MPVYAEEVPRPYVTRIVPLCSLEVTKDLREVCAYNLDQWKSLLKVDAELVMRRGHAILKDKKIGLLIEQKGYLKKQLELCMFNQVNQRERLNILYKDLIDLDKKYQEERVKPKFGPFIPWAISVTLATIVTWFIIEDHILD